VSLGNCPRCGHVFFQVPGGVALCPACIKNEEENYKKVFQFFSEKPSATAQDIATATGVEIKEIFKFVRENRLQLVKNDGSLKCEKCGNFIRSGKYCDNCRKKLSDEITKDIDKYKSERMKTNEKYSISRDRSSGNIIRKRNSTKN
jgi:flagellar operon protein (TIGR03826 family)